MRGALLLLLAAVLLGLFKPYLIFPAAVGVGAWVGIGRQERLLQSFLGGVVMLGLAAVVAELSLDRFAPSALLQQVVIRQGLVGLDPSASAYAIGDADATTWAGQLGFVPVALFTGALRPGLWEAHNGMAVVAGLENAVLAALSVAALYRVARSGVRAPGSVLLACLGLCALALVGIGLTTTNLGTLSRHRAPLCIFLWFPVLSMFAWQRREPG
jgi:hypothetical protein